MWCTVLIIIIISVLIYWFINRKYSYWQRKGVQIPFRPIFPLGHTKQLFFDKIHFGYFWKNIYDALKEKNLKFGGCYIIFNNTLVAVDPELIKHILVKDFDHFTNHGFYVNEKDDPLTGHLFALDGERWKTIRTKLTPAFSLNKIKMMFDTVLDCTKELNTIFDSYSEDGRPVDVKDIFSRFTVDVIGSCAFGLECNSLKNPNETFRKYGRKFFETNPMFTFILPFLLPTVFNLLKLKIIPEDVTDFFLKTVEDTVKYREKNNVYRKDFMHLLIQLKNRGNNDDGEKLTADDGSVGEFGLKMTELAAQAFIFFAAGFETSSSTLAFAAYEIAQNKNMQEKIRQEIRTVLENNNNQLTYEALAEMKYLDCVVYETLRKYPIATGLPRVCTKDYNIPNSSVVIEKGTYVVIPTIGLHYDKEYYPDPEKFDPDRFSEANKSTRPSFAYLPFGEGPRICIGMKFGLIEVKLGLVNLFKNYSITLNEKTKVPLEIPTSGVLLDPKDLILINVHKIQN